MSLDSLIGISLEHIDTDASVIQRLLSAAERNIADAHVMEISSENRFDAAYKQLCNWQMWLCSRMDVERSRVNLVII